MNENKLFSTSIYFDTEQQYLFITHFKNYYEL